ncbi:Serine--tRNA ligase [endosymbiont DhMRE of Dentiscutata heterogama]|uniref:serine--tRNA ligase n=1 Tax=endosymbiont DhMRE of Dentiscutata heterogama TaxID=1609546 RepID=UPI000629D856|nr:serine--tRNA ligase [endosymbiont DhMRE of Dentiscutata heterogama]CFW93250.1 Serine--tRNA ligase [endosymbiont DhMRE of Dentiscutata heterogama]
MLDLKKLFTDFPGLVRGLESRGVSEEQLTILRERYKEEKEIIHTLNKLRQQRNQLEGPNNAEKVREVREEIAFWEEKLRTAIQEVENLANQIPNLPAPDTPTNEEGNRVVASTEYQHTIQHNLTHETILKKLKLIDEEKSILLSGSKFAVYQGFGSQLLHALINFMRAENSKRGYLLFDTPYLVKAHNLYNTGQFHKFQDNLYKLEESDFYLLPTAEVSLVNLYQNQILTEAELPLNLCAYSPCFRAERMASGQENKGLIRLHQFHKVELVKIVEPANSYDELKKMLTDARNILHLLKIPHRVIELCHQELGFTAAKTYDIEVWLPISQKWLEISSCSNCEDFQSRRAQIRVKKENQKYYPHTLNGSALAVDRLIIALCEYYYNEKENKLIIPEILQKYF